MTRTSINSATPLSTPPRARRRVVKKGRFGMTETIKRSGDWHWCSAQQAFVRVE